MNEPKNSEGQEPTSAPQNARDETTGEETAGEVAPQGVSPEATPQDKSQSDDYPESGPSAELTEPPPPEKSAGDPPPPPPTAPTGQQRRRPLLLAALLVLALIATGAALAAVFQLWRSQGPVSAQVETLLNQDTRRAEQLTELQEQLAQLENARQQQERQLERRLAQQQQDLDQHQQRLDQQQQSFSQQLSRVEEQQRQALDRLAQRVDNHQQRLVALSNTNREDWLLAEAEYLLNLANQRILLERSPVNALALLESTDRIVRRAEASINDPELHAVREAIARDITALSMVEPVDRVGLYLQLQTLADRLDQLPRTPRSTLLDSAGEPAIDDQESHEAPWWRRIGMEIRSAVGLLSDYVKIGDTEDTIKPLASQQAQEMADLNVRLLVEQAQVALLREQEDIYQNSLARATQWVERFYIPSEQSQALQDALNQLREQPITVDLPDISRSARLLRSYIEQTHQLPSEDEQP